MKLLVTIFTLVALIGSPLVFAEESDKSDKSKDAATAAAAADSDSKNKKEKSGDKKKATEEEPDCD